MSSYKLPGSLGEHLFPQQQGSQSPAQEFYRKQMLDRLNPTMRAFLAEQEMFFLATTDGKGRCDCSFCTGERGVLRTLDERTLCYPEYRANGVCSSLSNIIENPHVSLLIVDFFHHGIGLHVNGKAMIRPHDERWRDGRWPPKSPAGGRPPELWVVVEVVEAYLHGSKHIPLLSKLPKEIEWGTDDVRKKGRDFFAAKECDPPWLVREEGRGLGP